MPDDRFTTSRVESVHTSTAKAQQAAQAQKMAQYAIAQESAAEEFQEWGDLNAWNPLALAKNFQPLDRRAREKTRPDDASQKEEDETVHSIESIKEISEHFQQRNNELQARSLLLLRSRITSRDSAADILRKVREAYTDFSLADEALDFLLETADPKMRGIIAQAKADFNRLYGKDIAAGRNMGAQAREFSTQGLGSPTALRDLYRNVTQNPREALTLFQELSTTYTYEKMKAVIAFLLHSLGSDMKSKGPSIERSELARLFTETRNMQAILGVYRFFKLRMAMILSSFERQGLMFPPLLSFEALAKAYMKFIQERYPSVDKALQIGKQLGISETIPGQIIVYVQMRDAMRQVAPKFFKDERHRQDILTCFMETLDELDEKLEEEEEKEEREGKK